MLTGPHGIALEVSVEKITQNYLFLQNFNINKFNVHILKTQKISKFVFTVYACINMCLVLIFTFHVIIS